jgi:hypothetical protein
MRRPLLVVLVVAGLSFASTAEAHRLYAGPARGFALRVIALVANRINSDQTTGTVIDRYGVSSCAYVDQHTRNCHAYFYGHDAANPGEGEARCALTLRVVISGTSYRPRLAGNTAPLCRQALRRLVALAKRVPAGGAAVLAREAWPERDHSIAPPAIERVDQDRHGPG